MPEANLIKFGVYKDEFEAQIVQVELQENGIESVIDFSLSGTGFDGFLQGVRGVSLFISEGDKEKALDVLKTASEEQNKIQEDEDEVKEKEPRSLVYFYGVWLIIGLQMVILFPLYLLLMYGYITLLVVYGGLDWSTFHHVGILALGQLPWLLYGYILYRTSKAYLAQNCEKARKHIKVFLTVLMILTTIWSIIYIGYTLKEEIPEGRPYKVIRSY